MEPVPQNLNGASASGSEWATENEVSYTLTVLWVVISDLHFIGLH